MEYVQAFSSIRDCQGENKGLLRFWLLDWNFDHPMQDLVNYLANHNTSGLGSIVVDRSVLYDIRPNDLQSSICEAINDRQKLRCQHCSRKNQHRGTHLSRGPSTWLDRPCRRSKRRI